MNILFACGGTGGHIYPAVALYDAFKKHDPGIKNTYLFVGSDYGLEKDIFSAEHLPAYQLITSRGLKRSLSLSNVKSLWCNLRAFSQAKRIVRTFRPDLVISTGGYPSFHITYRAAKQKIPFFLIEGNALPGIVVRWFHRKAERIFAATDLIRRHLKTDSHLRVTGLPSRSTGVNRSKSEILKDLGFDESDQKVVAVTGGSCGSPALNAAVSQLVAGAGLPYRILWATGKKNYAQISDGLTDTPKQVKMVAYIHNMREVLSIADLIVARAGAMTIQEIKDFKLPAILVPFAKAAGNHQYRNALEMKKLGVAGIIEEKEISGARLRGAIEELLSEGEKVREIYENSPIRSGDISETIYGEIMDRMGKACIGAPV